MARGFMRLAVWLYRRSGGKIGGSMRGVPVLLITTTGRRSGQPWTVPVLYTKDGDGWVVIASNGGSPRHPAWWLNLRANPDASIQVGKDVYAVTGKAATGAERDRLWHAMTDVYSGYKDYTRKTTRILPVVVLRKR
jgi:F420H(2)-dependent quinone reductase